MPLISPLNIVELIPPKLGAESAEADAMLSSFKTAYGKYMRSSANIEILSDAVGYLQKYLSRLLESVARDTANTVRFITFLRLVLLLGAHTKQLYETNAQISHSKQLQDAYRTYKLDLEYKFMSIFRTLYGGIGYLNFLCDPSTAVAISALLHAAVWETSKRLSMVYGTTYVIAVQEELNVEHIVSSAPKELMPDVAFPVSEITLANFLYAMDKLSTCPFKSNFALSPQEKKILLQLHDVVGNTLNRREIYVILALIYAPVGFFPVWDEKWGNKDNSRAAKVYRAIVRIMDGIEHADVSAVEKELDASRIDMCRYGGYMRFACWAKLRVRAQLLRSIAKYLANNKSKCKVRRHQGSVCVPVKLYGMALAMSYNYRTGKDANTAVTFAVEGFRRYSILKCEIVADDQIVVCDIK